MKELTKEEPIGRKLISISHASRVLGLNPRIIRKLIALGKIKAIDVAGTRRVSMQSVIDFSAGKEV